MSDDLTSAYGISYNPFPVIAQLGSNRESAIEELWENLHHQGDIGTASIAAVPLLVKAGELSLVACIATVKASRGFASASVELEEKYTVALKQALDEVPLEQEHYQGYLTIHAVQNNQIKMARALNTMSIEEILTEYG